MLWGMSFLFDSDFTTVLVLPACLVFGRNSQVHALSGGVCIACRLYLAAPQPYVREMKRYGVLPQDFSPSYGLQEGGRLGCYSGLEGWFIVEGEHAFHALLDGGVV